MASTNFQIFESNTIASLEKEVDEFIKTVTVLSLSMSHYKVDGDKVIHCAALVYLNDDAYDKHLEEQYINQQG